MKKYFFAYYLLFSLLFFTVDARAAYIDPSVMTYAIQAIAGLAITLGTVAGMYWRKIRKRVFHDSDSDKKNIESDALVFQDPASGTTLRLDYEVKTEKKAKEEKSKEFLPAVFLAFALSFMICLYTPLEIYFTNVNEFVYDFYSIFKYLLLLFAIVFALITAFYYGVYKLFNKAYYLMIVLGTIAFICFYVQGVILIGDLPPTDGTKADWSQFHAQKMQSLMLWVIVTVICAVLAVVIKKKKFFQLTKVLSAGISGILLVTLLTVAVNNNGFRRKIDICISNDGLSTMSSDKNFIIFVVDSVDSMTFQNLMNTSDPEFRDIFRDFTYYPDTLAAYPYTTLAVPHLMTGEWYKCQGEFRSYFSNAMKTSPVLKRLKEEGYKGAIYSEHDVVFDDLEFLEYENLYKHPYELGDAVTFMLDELRLSFFMHMPYQLKKYEPYAIYNLQNEAPADYYYSWLDPWIYNYFDTHEIELEKDKRFRFIHTEGAHLPIRYVDRQFHEDYDAATYETNVEACVTVVERYLRSLRESGAYDNSAIVILADHGYADNKELAGRENPLLMIKGINEKHDMEVSDLPISYAYLPDIYHNLLDGKNGSEAIPDNIESLDRYFLRFPEDEIYDLKELELPAGAKAYETEKLKETGVQYHR